RIRDELLVAANFAEVFLAKRGHDGWVGVNYLEKIQLATPAAVYGAMLAGVEYVLMGAGVPAGIPQLLGSFAAGRPGEIGVNVVGAPVGAAFSVRLDPREVFGAAPILRRPRFLAKGADLVTEKVQCTKYRPAQPQRHGVHGRKTGVDRGRNELRPPLYFCRQVIDLNRGVGSVAVKAWPLFALQLKDLQVARSLRRRREHVQRPVTLGEQQARRGDIEQSRAIGGQPRQQVHHVHSVDQAVR
ncbi:MAG TPA: hypothetical protein VFG00_05710, partial [Acidothermaceae bacterium]|nr:hypothetical protein [Acidothermaceae bacterium]